MLLSFDITLYLLLLFCIFSYVYLSLLYCVIVFEQVNVRHEGQKTMQDVMPPKLLRIVFNQ